LASTCTCGSSYPTQGYIITLKLDLWQSPAITLSGLNKQVEFLFQRPIERAQVVAAICVCFNHATVYCGISRYCGQVEVGKVELRPVKQPLSLIQVAMTS
jgi:hypothetical protein